MYWCFVLLWPALAWSIDLTLGIDSGLVAPSQQTYAVEVSPPRYAVTTRTIALSLECSAALFARKPQQGVQHYDVLATIGKNRYALSWKHICAFAKRHGKKVQ